ncbi:hypothetical protein MBLNU459_g4935t3 [Dothideomycetes sp. NU459]
MDLDYKTSTPERFEQGQAQGSPLSSDDDDLVAHIASMQMKAARMAASNPEPGASPIPTTRLTEKEEKNLKAAVASMYAGTTVPDKRPSYVHPAGRARDEVASRADLEASHAALMSRMEGLQAQLNEPQPVGQGIQAILDGQAELLARIQGRDTLTSPLNQLIGHMQATMDQCKHYEDWIKQLQAQLETSQSANAKLEAQLEALQSAKDKLDLRTERFKVAKRGYLGLLIRLHAEDTAKDELIAYLHAQLAQSAARPADAHHAEDV